MLKKALTLGLALSLALPVWADNFDELSRERQILFNKVMAGNASDQDVQRFQRVTQQIKELQAQQVQTVTQQQQDLRNNFNRVQQQNEQVYRSLFNGPTTGGSGNSSQPSTDTGSSGSSSDAHELSYGGQPSSNHVPETDKEQPISPINKKSLAGSISIIDLIVNNLVDTSLANNSEYQAAKDLVIYYSTPFQKALASGKDTFNYLIPYRGFAPSAEAGKALLDEEVKTKSLAAALYKQQMLIDQTHLAIMTAILQMSQEGGVTEGKGYQALIQMVGNREAEKIHAALIDSTVEAQGKLWDISTMQEKHKILLKAAIDRDAVCQDIVDSIHKYTKRGMASKILMPLMGAASLAPSVIGPAVRGALSSYLMLNHGSNEDKLVKEVYLDLRLTSRVTMLSEEVTMAIEARQLAIATDNFMLMGNAMGLMEQMTGIKTAAESQ